MPIAALPELETRVAALARRIAGENPSTNRADLARRVAEAQVDLQRVRAAKLLFSNGSTAKGTMAITRLTSKALDGAASADAQIEAQQDQVYSSPKKDSDAEDRRSNARTCKARSLRAPRSVATQIRDPPIGRPSRTSLA